MRLLILDNYDSFTYNLVQIVKEIGYNNVEVHRNDKIELEAIDRFDKIILSPGPGIPSESGILLPLIKEYAPKKSILGVCLGHQAIAEAFGAKLRNLSSVYHGISTPVTIIADDPLWEEIPETFNAGRYHSWIVNKQGFPDELKIMAIDRNEQIMALRHRTYDVYGVQFHPESVLTPEGKTIIFNFLAR